MIPRIAPRVTTGILFSHSSAKFYGEEDTVAAIFISYRRNDSSSATGRLTDKLIQYFGPEHVFRDLEAIEAGADFPAKLREAIQAATVVLVIIGRAWLSIRGPNGSRRLDQPSDHVRREIETGLDNHIALIPVLVEQASMPSADELPDTIKALANRHAHEIDNKRWTEDVEKLIQLLKKDYSIEPADPSHPPPELDRTFYALIGQYFQTLIHLILYPKKTLLSTNLGRRLAFTDAVVFGLLTTAMATALLVALLPTAKTYWSMIAIIPLIAALFVLLMSMPLYAAWRLVGARTPYRGIAIPFFYQAAIALLAMHSILAINALLISLVDIQLGDKVLKAVRNVDDIENKLNTIRVMAANALQFDPTYAAFTTVTILVVVACIGWLAASWGSYRLMLGFTRPRSCVAFLFFIMLIAAPVYAVISIADWVAS